MARMRGLVGKNLNAVKDQNGFAFVDEMIGRESCGQMAASRVHYVWPKGNGSNRAEAKDRL